MIYWLRLLPRADKNDCNRVLLIWTGIIIWFMIPPNHTDYSSSQELLPRAKNVEYRVIHMRYISVLVIHTIIAVYCPSISNTKIENGTKDNIALNCLHYAWFYNLISTITQQYLRYRCTSWVFWSSFCFLCNLQANNKIETWSLFSRRPEIRLLPFV